MFNPPECLYDNLKFHTLMVIYEKQPQTNVFAQTFTFQLVVSIR